MTDFVGRQRLRVALLGMLTAAGGLLCSTSVIAQTAPPFAQLFRETENAPRQIELQAEIDRAQGLAHQAGALPNPTVSVTTENIAGQRPYRGFDRAENTLQLSQPIELGGKRSARIAAGEAGLQAARARGIEGRLAYAYDLARAYGEAEIADRRIQLAEGELEEAEADLRAARALVSAGKEARLRSVQAETEVNSLRATVDTAKADRVGAYGRLSALAGQATPYVNLSQPLLAWFEPKPYGLIDPTQTASYITARAERDAAARRETSARRQAVPDLTVSVGARRLNSDNATALVAGVSIPLPLFDRNRGNIAAAQAELRGAEARAAGMLLEVEAEISASRALNEAADARVAAADRTLKTADETYRMARIAYESGKSPLIELIGARRGLGVARRVVLDAAAARLDARASLSRLQGLTITGEPVQ